MRGAVLASRVLDALTRDYSDDELRDEIGRWTQTPGKVAEGLAKYTHPVSIAETLNGSNHDTRPCFITRDGIIHEINGNFRHGAIASKIYAEYVKGDADPKPSMYDSIRKLAMDYGIARADIAPGILSMEIHSPSLSHEQLETIRQLSQDREQWNSLVFEVHNPDDEDAEGSILTDYKSLSQMFHNGNRTIDAQTSDGGEGSGDFGHAGRPGEVGGSGEGGSDAKPYIPMSKTLSVARREENKWDKVLDVENGNVPQTKDAVCRALAERLKSDSRWPYYWQESYNQVNDYIHEWACSSGGTEKVAIAMQLAANDEFEHCHGDTTHFDERTLARAQVYYQEHADEMRAFLRAQYENTQAYFTEHGIKDVTLYRGMSNTNEQSQVPINATKTTEEHMALQPISAFCTRLGIATMFPPTEYPHQITMACVVPQRYLIHLSHRLRVFV